MNLKIFNHIKLSKTTPFNNIQIFRYECPVCKVFDFYLCTDPQGVTWCGNCEEILYFKEMIECKNPDLCSIHLDLQIGEIRTEEEDRKFKENIEKKLLKDLKLKYGNE